MNARTVVLIVALSVAGCASNPVPPAPRQGRIPPADGGAAGYQHGTEGSLFSIGGNAGRVAENGYLKQVGDQGALAIDASNGSAFGVPDADAPGLRSPPYGASPADHDAFVKRYFVGLGIPAEQVGGIRPMTLLEASGTGDEKSRPRVVAYYSVLDRVVEGIPVPNSFAWARVDAAGDVVAEAVYWPALPGEVVVAAERLEEMISDQQQRSVFAARLPTLARTGAVAIRHSSAWVRSPFETLASLDVIERTPAPQATVVTEGDRSSARSIPLEVVIRHYDAEGVEHFLPQERRDIDRDAGAPR